MYLSRVKKVKKYFFAFFCSIGYKVSEKKKKKNPPFLTLFQGVRYGGVRNTKTIKLFLCGKYCRVFLKLTQYNLIYKHYIQINFCWPTAKSLGRRPRYIYKFKSYSKYHCNLMKLSQYNHIYITNIRLNFCWSTAKTFYRRPQLSFNRPDFMSSVYAPPLD